MSQTEDEAEEISEDNEEQRTESGEETEEWQEENSQATEVQDYRIDDGGEGDYVDYDGLQWVKADWGEEGFEPRKDDVGSVESVYNSADFISKPILSEGGTISLDILQFDFSYGYNCRKYFNMCVLDDDNLVFESGNYLHFFNVETKEIWFRRSALGGGIGHIRKNPKKAYQHLAVAECGNKPIIIIYEWPTMEIFAVLREGTTRSYTHMDYSPDGLLLASQGGEPDYNITVWDWPKKKILLRTKSYVNDVYRVNFSLFVPGQLITCGVAHIKFWKMADTFTGLKLKGEVGRFGKTEYTDIVGLFAMPDGKILSGCSWGNILLWDDGLITLEIMRSQRKRCHDAPIVQMYYNGEELFTVSMDGHIKVWWWEKIDNADPPDDDRVIQVEPNYDFYEPGVMLMYMRRRAWAGPNSQKYLTQDGNGGIWSIDLNLEAPPEPSVQIFNCHGGKIMDLAACPYDNYFVSLGSEGKFFLYDYLKKERIYMRRFEANGTCMIWLPVEVQACGDVLILGFDDGQLRMCVLTIDADNSDLSVVQVVKPHNKPIVKMSLNKSGTILVTAGEDSTIFVLQLKIDEESTKLLPIGYIKTPEIVSWITWCPKSDAEVLVGCDKGYFMQSVLPTEPQDYTTISYLLDAKPRTNRFVTYKAMIRRNIRIAEIEARKALKVEKKRKEMEKLIKENPGIAIDEEVFLADSDSEEELEPLHIPEVPNKILWLKYTERDTIWISMGGYDAGYMYEYFIDQMDSKPNKFKMVADADDIEINSYLYSYKNQYMIFAMQDGSIRFNKVNSNDFTDFSNHWTLPMHDNFNGFIPKMTFSCDERYFFTCGHDGSLFAYTFNPTQYERKKIYHILLPNVRATSVVALDKDKAGYEKLSLEETIVKAEEDRINRVANEHKNRTRQTLQKMQLLYESVLQRNAKLLPSQKISKEELEIDSRVTEYIQEQLDGRINLVKRKWAYDVEKSTIKLNKIKSFLIDTFDLFPIIVHCINSNDFVFSLRYRKITGNLDEIKAKLEERLIDEEAKGRQQERVVPVAKVQEISREIVMEREYFLLSLSEDTIQNKLDPRMVRLLDKYRRRIAKWKYRAIEWEIFNAKKPKEGVNHPEDEIAFEEAKSKIGDYVLKTDENYRIPAHLRKTTTSKYKDVLECKETLYNIQRTFSLEVYALRRKKYEIIDKIIKQEEIIKWIHQRIPSDLRRSGPVFEKYIPSEFPEKMFNVCVEMETIEKKEIELDEESEVYLKCPFDDDFMVQILPKRNNFPPRPAGELFFDVLDIQKHLRTIPDSTLKDLIQNAKNEKVDTYYEREMRAWMLNKLLFQQQHSIDQINMLIDQINEDIRNLYLQLNYKVYTLNRLRLHIMALNQELAVLKRFERNEFILEKQVQENNTAVLDMTDAITDLMNKISDINRLIDDCNVKMEAIFQSFTQATNNNKFYDFLRKVFKKKFKVPRIREEDDSSSDSSSSSSDESDDDDAASLDSRDFGFIKLDLNVCPKGCEQAIYDYTVQLRQKRYEIEASVKENEKQIETYRKELEMHNKKLGVLEGNYQKSKQSLWEYQREKQRVLNDIIYTLVVKMDQFQYIENFNVENCVVMSKNTLSRLYSRVSELQQEGLHEKEKHEIYIRHLMRMKRDFHFMDQQIRKLKQEISYQMFIKFGRMVDIDDVELYVIKSTLKSDLTDMAEVCIKKMVYDLRRKNVGEATKSFKKEIKRLITFKAKKQFDYINLLKTNTAKAELLRILNKKRGLLEADLNSQDVKMMSFEYYDEQIKQDKVELEKMQGIIESQENEIQDLKDEIQMLKTKGYPPRPVRERRKMEEVEEPIDFAEYFKTFVDAGEEDEERISADIILPYIYTDAEAIVRSLIEDLMIQTEELAEKRSTEKMAREIVERVLKCTSCHAIVRELIDNLPITPSDEQLKMIDETASRLLQIQDLDEDDGEIKFQLETEEEKQAYFLELVEQIIDEVMLIHGEPYEVMTRLLMRVVEEVPVLYLIRKECIDKLANQFGSKISLEGLRNEILPEIECISDFHKEDLRTVASAVILRMQGSADVVARELVEDLVDTILLERGKTFNVMAHIIERLVASIPVQVLMQEESFDNIADVIKDKFDRKLDYEPLLEGISSVELSRIMDVRAILNIILHRVYGEGLDYLYVVNNARQYRVQGYNIDVEPE